MSVRSGRARRNKTGGKVVAPGCASKTEPVSRRGARRSQACIDRVTSQNGDRVLVERLATPRLPPKVTLKSYWQTAAASNSSSSLSQLELEDDTRSVWKQRATWESRAKVRDDTKHATEFRATRQLVLLTSEAKDDTHLTVKEATH